jgi:hypothetical protein
LNTNKLQPVVSSAFGTQAEALSDFTVTFFYIPLVCTKEQVSAVLFSILLDGLTVSPTAIWFSINGINI